MGHDVRLMPPSYVKPHVKRGKTDAADAAAICEAVTRPTMRFVAVKSEACSSVLVLHRTRDFLVRQRTQIGNAIRAHMTEFGIITAKGAQNVDRLQYQLDRLPQAARLPVSLLFDQLAETDERIGRLTEEIKEIHAQNETSQRLATIPGVGMLSATIIAATTPGVNNFDCARDYAAWLGLTPKPHSTRRQAEGQPDLEDGQSIYPPAALSGSHGADHAQMQAQARAGVGLVIGHAHPEEDESRRHRPCASHGENHLCRPPRRYTLPAAGRCRLTGSGNGQGKVR
jgi:hypothetical protein